MAEEIIYRISKNANKKYVLHKITRWQMNDYPPSNIIYEILTSRWLWRCEILMKCLIDKSIKQKNEKIFTEVIREYKI